MATLVMVIEVQLRPDADKRFSWPAYVTNARARHQCDATLVVVTPYKYVAAWARKPISLGPGSGHVQPLVFGPNEVPAIVDGAQARQNPELAVLSAITHGRDRNFAHAANIATQAIAAAMSMPDGNGQVYYDWILAALSHSARKALRMIPQNYEYKDAGLRRAKNEGEAKGKAEGEAKGKAEGELLGLRNALLTVLQTRALIVNEKARARILTCSDPHQLRSWLVSAVTTASVDSVLGK